MKAANAATVEALKKALVFAVATQTRASQTQPDRDLVDTLLSTSSEDGLGLLHTAARGSKKRLDGLVLVLLERGDSRCAISDRFVEEVLATPSQARSMAIQAMATHPQRKRFAPTLRHIASNRADDDWASSVITLGTLQDPGAGDVLLEHTSGLSMPFVVLHALVQLRCAEALPVFEANLQQAAYAYLRTVGLGRVEVASRHRHLGTPAR